MAGLQDWFGAVSDLFSNVQVDSPQSRESSALSVVKHTASAFALVDPLLTTFAWDVSEDATPEHFHEQARMAIEREINVAITADEVHSDADAIDKVLDTARAVEETARNLEPPGNILHNMSEVDFSESKLNAQEVLKASVRIGLQTVYRALIQQLQCCGNGHLLRLKLTGFIDQIDEQSRLFFDTYLSNRHFLRGPCWVQSKCTIANGLNKPEIAGCQFIRDAEDHSNNLSILLEEKTNQTLSEEKKDTRKAECLVFKGTNLQLDGCSPLESPAAPTKGLWELLEHSDYEDSEFFSLEDRDRLCLNLALSLLHLSTNCWSRTSWSSDRNIGTGIFFLRDPATQRIVDRTHAYISCELQGEPKLENEDDLVCDPQLLDFARLLTEVHMWKRLALPRQGGKLSRTQLHTSLLKLIDNNQIFHPKRDAMFKKAVKACLDAAGREAARDELRKDRLHNYIFEKIVRPLDHYACFPDLSISTSIFSPSKNAMEPQTSFFDWKELTTPEDNNPRGDDFLSKMDNFTEDHIKNLAGSEPLLAHRSQKIRVAIIDSGIATNDPVVKKLRRQGNIQKCRNFSSSHSDDCTDTVGHGTMVARLLARVAPEAELFIAKVTNSRYIPNDKVYCIAKAINWAVHRWNVDIVTMSLVLEDENPDIDEELNMALNPLYDGATRKIVFAAAGSNSGGNERRSWPARKDGVIAIHATDGLGTGANINPSSERELCFATLGRDIKFNRFVEGDPQNIYISGTSFATPIATGIAANVLEYSRHRIDDLTEERKRRLYSAGCIQRIFKEMSSLRGDYHYVQPWIFWKKCKDERWWRGQDLRRIDDDPVAAVLKLIINDY